MRLGVKVAPGERNAHEESDSGRRRRALITGSRGEWSGHELTSTVNKLQAAAADGKYNIQSNDPDYNPNLDRDGDGVACEKKN